MASALHILNPGLLEDGIRERMSRKPATGIELEIEGDGEPEEEDNWSVPVTKATNERLRQIALIAADFGSFRPAKEVLTLVRSVPTIFPQFDFATRVGGVPLARFIVIHGPSSHGKTSFAIGLAKSFLLAGHFAFLVDAEMTTPFNWVESLIGEAADTPFFNALRPKSYEETVESVRVALNTIIKAKKAGKLDKNTSAIIVVDSLRKLVPENILKKVLKGENGVDGMGGRAAQIKAAMNAAWLDELIPLLHDSEATMVVIARESENTESKGFFDQDWKMTGGKAIEFDSSLIARICRQGYVKEGAGEQSTVIGEKHLIAIRKTKVAGKDDKVVKCFFHTSNGKLTPEGFDRGRDVIELALEFGIIQKNGSFFSFGGKRIQGVNGLVSYCHANQQYLEQMEAAVRAKFKENDPLMIDAEQVEGETNAD